MDLLEELQKQIEASDKKIKSLKAAYKALSGDEQAPLPKKEDASNQNQLGETGVINLDDLEPSAKVSPRVNTLNEAVKGVIVRFDKKEFTVSHVFRALEQMGKVSTNAKHYKNRVSMAIRKLTEDGFLKRTYEGKGNEPHKYQEAAFKLNEG